MNVAGVVNRVMAGDLSYVLGRFHTVRSAYGSLRRTLEAMKPASRNVSHQRSPLFPDANVNDIVRAVRDEAVFIGLNLPPTTVEAIKSFALTEPLHAIYDPKGPTFRYAEVSNGVAADGRRMPIGGVSDPARCPEIREIINDPALRAVVRGYLGHEPRKITTILDWSFGSNMSDEERRQLKHHVIDYHYDVGGYDFLYASFYITDTDRHSGAHVMIRRSHKNKPLKMLLGSARASQEAVYREFGRENELIIEGPAGTGFVEDTSCYHRASPPTRGDRLMLAIRFIN